MQILISYDVDCTIFVKNNPCPVCPVLVDQTGSAVLKPRFPGTCQLPPAGKDSILGFYQMDSRELVREQKETEQRRRAKMEEISSAQIIKKKKKNT